MAEGFSKTPYVYTLKEWRVTEGHGLPDKRVEQVSKME